MSRLPSLADRVLASHPRASVLKESYYEDSRLKLLAAKKFVLDTQAATYLGDMIREHPRIVADAQDFAIRPYDLMWVELPFRVFYQAVTGRASDATGDRAVGYLFIGPEVRVASESFGAGLGWNSFFNPARYFLHRPMTPDDVRRMTTRLGISPLGLDLWFWGESIDAFTHGQTRPGDQINADLIERLSEWDKEGLRSLRANHTADIAPIQPGFEPQMIKGIVNGSAGDLRNIVALLLFLNRTQDIQYQQSLPLAHTLIKRKPRPMLPITTIRLKLDPKPRIVALVAGAGIKRRLHDVRGHFCHDRTARAGCPHGEQHAGDWGEWWEEYDVLRWRCSQCHGKRWWRHEHKRGHAELGVINIQNYEVTR